MNPARFLMVTIILVIVILSSTLAAGIVQDSLPEKLEKARVCWRSWRRRAPEEKWRRLEATSVAGSEILPVS